jgi:hypothetical protein
MLTSYLVDLATSTMLELVRSIARFAQPVSTAKVLAISTQLHVQSRLTLLREPQLVPSAQSEPCVQSKESLTLTCRT